MFPLHPGTPEGGLSLAELFAGRRVDIAAMNARMQQLMDEAGLPWRPRDRTYNSRLAQELGKWADEQGQPALHEALYRAYFAEGLDISLIDVLAGIAERVGLPGDEARRVLEERRYREAVDRDWARARALGVTGVPTYVASGRGVVGAQPYEVLERLVTLSGARRRA
jgi:predicted DsbA family dithiol-disulfide isomerase